MFQLVFWGSSHPSIVSYYWSSALFFTAHPTLLPPILHTHTHTQYTPPVGTAYEGAHKQTFLAMSITIAPQLPIMLILVLLYHKLGKLRKKNMNSNATESLPSSTHSSNSDQDGASDNEDSTEMSKLLALEKKPLEKSSN